jgi:hypothetical protein
MKTYKPFGRLMLVVAIGLALSSCGSDSNDVASLGATPTTELEEAVLDDEAKVMAFVECMREQGVELLDPEVDADGNVQVPAVAEGFQTSKAEWIAADEVCGELLEGVTFAQKEAYKTEELDWYVELATCLREQGFDLDDPTAETLEAWLTDLKTVFDWEDPQAVEAYELCSGQSIGGGGKGK